MLKKVLAVVFVFLAASGLHAQLSVKVTDAQTGESLAGATLKINDSQATTNADGVATIPKNQEFDHTLISAAYLGYRDVTMTLIQLRQNQMIIKLQPIAYQLNEVDIKKAVLNPDTIIAQVKKNLAKNYRGSGSPIKNVMFYRETSIFKPIQARAEMSKSTKLSKKDLDKLNAEVSKFTQQLIKHPPQGSTELLANYYTAVKTHNDKPVMATKFTVLKAIKYRKDPQALSVDDVEKEGKRVLMKHLDSTKAYRIKSGLFGTRDTVIGYKEAKKDKPNLASARSMVMSSLYMNTLLSTRFTFVAKPELYEYTLAGTVPYGDGYVYKLKFKPRKRKAKYAGVLYVSPVDYAVLRADYDLAEGKVLGGVNLKLILGVKQTENVSRGTLVFENRAEGGYYLKYSGYETGQYVYVNRPLKFIEITDSSKEKVAYDLLVEVNVLEKEEYLNMSREEIDIATYDAAQEQEFNYETQQVYNPAVWNGLAPTPPEQQIQKLKTAVGNGTEQ